MKTALTRLRTKLGQDVDYFHKVYIQTFDFAKVEGQRSIGALLPFSPSSPLFLSLLAELTPATTGIDTATAFWGLLLPHAMAGGALARLPPSDDAMQVR